MVLAAAAAALVAAAATWLVAFSPVLGVRSVEVNGAHQVSAAQVRAAAGIRPGTPLVRLDTAAVMRRLQALPEIASARLHRSLPGKVVIDVSERVAVGALSSGGKYVLVDRSGVQFRTVSTPPKSLPTFVVPTGARARATGAALARVAAALPADLRARVGSIQALGPDTITLLLTDRRVVRWGSAERSAEKARVLAVLLARPASEFDVADPDQPFTR